MVYKWRDYTPQKARKIDANIAGKVCEELTATGGLTAARLLDASRPADAPLHDAFTWDDTEAAELWRTQEARLIINHIEIVNEYKEPVRAFFNIEREEPTYTPITAIIGTATEEERLLETALAELKAFQRKYSMLKELCGVFTAIEELTKGETK